MERITTCLTLAMVLTVSLALKCDLLPEEPTQPKQYYISNESKTFNDAAKDCDKMKMKLVELINYHDQVSYMRALEKKKATEVIYWIGGRIANGKWTWHKSGSNLNYSYWVPGYPKDGSCITTATIFSEWVDEKCDKKHQYVCERSE